MSYVALATDRFDETAAFYGARLGFPTVRSWDRPGGRGRVFDLGGLRLEILDASREERRLELADPLDRVHLVVEVDDVDGEHRRLGILDDTPRDTTWGSRLFRVRDPDGTWITFLQWTSAAPDG